MASCLFAVGAFAQEVDALLPWTDGDRIRFGMSRAAFEEVRPQARNTYFGDGPLDPTKPFKGSFILGDSGELGTPMWIFIFENDLLSWVVWALASDDTERETGRIREILVAHYGKPRLRYLARLNKAGRAERISKEVFRNEASRGYSIALVATDTGGVEVSVTLSENLDVAGFDEEVQKLAQTGISLHTGPPLILDILAKMAGRD